jgi:hypothetical protein
VSANKISGGEVLTAFSSRIRSSKRRYDLESYDECVCVEIPTLDSLKLLIGNHYFPPDTKPEVITKYFHSLEDRLDTKNFRAVMVWDFNTSGFGWNHGLSVPDSHYYSKLSGDEIYTSTCLLNLKECIEAVGSSNFLGLVFTNFSDYDINFPDSRIIKTDTYHTSMVIGITLPLVNPT